MKTSLKIFFAVIVSAIVSSYGLMAQNQTVKEGYQLADSVIYRPAATVDSTLVGKNVFDILPSKTKGASSEVVVSQSPVLEKSMAAHVQSNLKRNMSGYRVRIFFDNKQSARSESEAALKRFESLYHGVKAYRSYANPYFKVTVGDFRTKSEAMELLEHIKPEFPSAFVVKENITFPVVDKDNAYVTDTVKVYRPVSQ